MLFTPRFVSEISASIISLISTKTVEDSACSLTTVESRRTLARSDATAAILVSSRPAIRRSPETVQTTRISARVASEACIYPALCLLLLGQGGQDLASLTGALLWGGHMRHLQCSPTREFNSTWLPEVCFAFPSPNPGEALIGTDRLLLDRPRG